MSNKKSCALEEKTQQFLYRSIQTRFWGSKETSKENYFHERKSKCMSMRRHRASLFMEQSVFPTWQTY